MSGRGGNQRGSGRGRGRGQERGRGRGRGRGGYGDGDRSNQPPTHHATKQVEKASPTSIPLPKTVSENETDIKPSPGKSEGKSYLLFFKLLQCLKFHIFFQLKERQI